MCLCVRRGIDKNWTLSHEPPFLRSFLSNPSKMSLRQLPFLQTRPEEAMPACLRTCMFTFCRKGMYTFVSIDWLRVGPFLNAEQHAYVCVNAATAMWALVC